MDREYIETLLTNTKDYYYFFRENIKNYGFDGFLANFNIEYMHDWFIKNIPHKEYIMFVTLGEKDFSKLILYLKVYPDIFLNFIKNSETYFSFFGYCDLDSFKTIYDMYKQHQEICDSNFIKGVSSDVLLSYINQFGNEEDIVVLLNNSYSLRKPFFNQNKDLAHRLIKESKINPSIIVNNNIKVPYEIAVMNEVFDSLKLPNIIDFRRKFNEFIEVNPYFELEDKLDKYEEDIIESFDISDSLIGKFKNINCENYKEEIHKINDNYLTSFMNRLDFDYEKIDEILKEFSRQKVSELIIDRLFKDNIYNVIIKINEMLNYIDEVKESILDNETLHFYKRILKYNNLSIIEKLNMRV